MRLLTLLLLHGCVKNPAALQEAPLDTVLIPGCPSNPDGTLSTCQWERVRWAFVLWETGETRTFITSGNAVQNRYIEAEALKAGLVALGVPDEVIFTETQALHTDENLGYALPMMQALQFETFGVASHGPQMLGFKPMARGWGHEMRVYKLQTQAASSESLPRVSTAPVPESEWLSVKARERVIAERRGVRPRTSSLLLYLGGAIRNLVKSPSPPEPPVDEPTLAGQRHRIDTAPWPEKPDETRR